MVKPVNHLHPSMAQFGGLLGRASRVSSKIAVIWFACVWVIWKARNEKTFRNKQIISTNMVDEAKVLSWKWLRFKSSSISNSISEWSNPRVFRSFGCLRIILVDLSLGFCAEPLGVGSFGSESQKMFGRSVCRVYH